MLFSCNGNCQIEYSCSFLPQHPVLLLRIKMIKSFEGIRGLAALIVALYHLNIGKEYFSILRHGYVFVDLFFVLSGFVICASYYKRIDSRDEFRSFMIRRFGRLFPLLVFSTVFFVMAENSIILLKRIAVSHGFGAALSNPGALNFQIPSAFEIASTLTFTHSLGIFDRLILNTPTWSISTEFYTYLLFAFACLFFKGKTRLAVFAAFVAVSLFITSWTSIAIYNCLELGACNTQTFDFGFPRCVLSFFLGALTFHLGGVVKDKAQQWQIPVLLLSAAYFWQIDSVPELSFLPPYLFSFMILSIWADKGALPFLLNRRFCQMLGQRSYSIYLMHLPLVLFFELVAKRYDGAMTSMAIAASYVFVLIVISGWTYKYIEDPFRLLFNRLSDRLSNESTISLEKVLVFRNKPIVPHAEVLLMKTAHGKEELVKESVATKGP